MPSTRKVAPSFATMPLPTDSLHHKSALTWPLATPTLTTAMQSPADSATFGLNLSRQSSSRPHKILYPLKKQAPGEHTQWMGMTPLEMITYIVSMANGSGSSRKSLPDQPSHYMVQQIGTKRKREDEDEIFDNDRFAINEADIVATCIQPIDDTFKAWTPSSYVDKSPHSENLNFLVEEFERVAVDPTKSWCFSSYNRVQQAFHAKVGVSGDPGKHDLAISEAIIQMKALLEMASHDVQEASKPSLSTSIAAASCPMSKSAAEAFQNTMNFWVKHNWHNPFPDDDMILHLSRFLVENRSLPLNNKDVATLTLAGTDPSEYDRTIAEIANEKITNWLVNCRTRRWRPSIERAFDLRRPVELLTEDSIRLYEGSEVRPLMGWDADLLFSFNPKYLTKLKMWKKDGRVSGAKKGNATKIRTRKNVKRVTEDWREEAGGEEAV